MPKTQYTIKLASKHEPLTVTSENVWCMCEFMAFYNRSDDRERPTCVALYPIADVEWVRSEGVQ